MASGMSLSTTGVVTQVGPTTSRGRSLRLVCGRGPKAALQPLALTKRTAVTDNFSRDCAAAGHRIITKGRVTRRQPDGFVSLPTATTLDSATTMRSVVTPH